MRVRGRAVAEQLGVWDRPARLGDLGRLEHEQRRALAHDEPVAPEVERPLGRAGLVVVARRQRADDVERPERERAQRDLAAAGDRGIDPALAQVAERLAERDRARRARVGGRQDRPADIERDAEVGRRRAAEDRQREVRCDLPDALLEIALVLFLGIGDPAERRPEIDPDPLRVRAAVRARASARRRRAPAGPATSPNWLNRSSWRAVLGGIQASGSKSSTCAATCERNGLGSNRSIRLTGERPARSPARNASRPVPIAVIIPSPVIQIRRRSLMSVVRRRAGRTVAAHAGAPPAPRRSPGTWPSVRPAMGRVKHRSTNDGERRRAAAGSRGRSRRARRPARVRSARSRPSPWSRRRRGRSAGRSVAGSFQVRARQVTGSAEPEDADERSARHEVDHERAIRPAPDRARPGVVGQQPVPALDVAGEREDERGRRRDVDGDRAAAFRRRRRGTASRPDSATRPSSTESPSEAAASSGVNQAHVSVEPSTSSRSSPPVTRTR